MRIELRERKWNSILVKSEVDEVWTKLRTKDGGEKPSISTSHGPVSALSTGQAGCSLITTLRRVAASISQTEGGSQREPEVLYFNTCTLTRRRWGTASVIFIISTYCDENKPGKWLLLNSQHLALETLNSGREQKTGKTLPPPANKTETGWRLTSVLQKALEVVNSHGRETAAHTSQGNWGTHLLQPHCRAVSSHPAKGAIQETHQDSSAMEPWALQSGEKPGGLAARGATARGTGIFVQVCTGMFVQGAWCQLWQVAQFRLSLCLGKVKLSPRGSNLPPFRNLRPLPIVGCRLHKSLLTLFHLLFFLERCYTSSFI